MSKRGAYASPAVWILFLLPVLGMAHALLYDCPFEDAYISFRYAENLASGLGLVYNPGEVVEGFTSFGWVMMLAGAKVVGLPVPQTAVTLSLFFRLCLIPLSARLAQEWLGTRSAVITAPPAVLVANGTWAYYTMTGMETTLFALLVTAALLAAGRTDRRSAVYAGLILAVASLVRPEGVGYSAVVIAALMLDREGRRQVPMLLGVLLLVFLPYFAWRWHHFGWPMPNTWYAKATPSLPTFRAGFHHAEEYLTTHGFWLAPIGGIAAVVLRGRERWSVLASAVVLGAIANVVLVGGDAFAFYRFLLPAVPAGAIAVVGGGMALARTRPLEKMFGGRPHRAVVAAMLVLLVAWTFAASFRPRSSLTKSRPDSHRQRVLDVEVLDEEYVVVGRWFRLTFAPDTLVALNAAGIVPYYSRLPTIDMLGLTDEHIAHVPMLLGRGTLGHEKHDADYVLSRRPDIIVLGLPVLTDRPARSEDLAPWFAKFWGYLPGDRQIFDDPRFRRDYVPYSVDIVPGQWFTFFLRRGSEP